MTTSLASEIPVPVSRSEFDTMLGFSRTVFQLKDNVAYLSRLSKDLPQAAHIQPEWPSVLMGFDFHLTPDGPKLIEINNNAGGLYIGDDRWIPQPDIPELQNHLEQRLAEMFCSEWTTIAIMDENVTAQFMYPEMLAYAELLRKDGRQVFVICPEQLQLRDDGLVFDGVRVDVIYNRHTDFYLEGDDVSHIRLAYERGQVAINPHPRSYALIGDKSRMVDWWREGLLEQCVKQNMVKQIRSVTPETHQLSELDMEQAWVERKQWVFKPAARHGGKGVLLGKAMSRKRYEALDVADTIVQRLVPASELDVEGLGGEMNRMKLDIRLYMHGEKLIALAGRVWRGQMTNFRQAGSGWVSIDIAT
ncbi:MAG: hypothetical protein Q9M08_05675 [Mariprofundus sp.]|nr:hypothetical protein [Mariprofundus sp.]